MDSFYGGKQGVSIVLKARFQSVDEMIKAFKGGGNYTNVWYGELCIIDTPNKNDKDNGKIYKRGLDYQNSMGGAVYIGQIVGPSSGTPYFQLNTINEVNYQATSKLNENEYKRYPTGYKEDSNGHVIGYETSDGSDGKPLAKFPFSKAHDMSLVPGKYIEDGKTKYRDEITWTWCNIRKDNADADSWFYVGFEFPYTVTDFSIHSVSPYDDDGNIQTDASEIERIDDEEHPFYAHWDLGLPKGIKGDTLKNLKVIVPNEGNKNNIYDVSAITTNSITGVTEIGSPGYDGIDDDILAQRKIVVFEYYIYDKVLNPKPILIYLGDFNIISDINVDDEGTLTVDYTHDDNSVFSKKIRWINNIELTEGNGSAGGHFTFTFNNDSPSKTKTFDISWIKGIEIESDGSILYTYAGQPDTLPDDASRIADGQYRVEDFLQWIKAVNLNSESGQFTVTNNRSEIIFDTTLDWIKDIDFNEDGTVILYHTKDNEEETLNNLIKWVKNVELDTSTGKFTMNFNYGQPLERQLDWIDNIYINEENGNIYTHHVFDSRNTQYSDFKGQLLDAKLKLVTSASVTSDGIITLHTNVGEDIRLNQQGNPGTAFKVKTIENITLNTGIYEDKHIQIKYNTESGPTKIGDPINYVQDMVVRSSDWHLLVLFNDPEHRVTAEDLDDDGKDKNGNRWYNNIKGSNGSTDFQKSDIYWRDMGAIKDQSGILVGFNLDSSTVEDAGYDASLAGIAGDKGDGTDGTGVCGYLQSILPNGLTGDENNPYGIGTKEKIVVYTPPAEEDSDKQDKEFYAFDYSSYRWFYLGRIVDSGMRDAKLLESNNVNAENLKTLSPQGLLFTSYSTTYSDSAIPKYWDITYKWV